MIRVAVADGVKGIVATSHIKEGLYKIIGKIAEEKRINKEIEKGTIPTQLLADLRSEWKKDYRKCSLQYRQHR